MAKIDLFEKEWLELVFAKKNKAYGAYSLRMQNGKNTSKSLLISASVFVFLFVAPKLYGLLKPKAEEAPMEKVTEVMIQPPPPIDPKVQTPPPVEPPPPKQDQIKFPPPVVKPDELVRDEQPPTTKDLKAADPGQKTIEGDPTSEVIVQTTVAGEGPKGAQVTEDNSTYNFLAMENPPTYPGGEKAFRKYLEDNLRVPDQAMEAGVSGRPVVSFLIDKDGTVTDVKVERKVGYGMDEAAIRIIKGSKRWNPGMQNGKPVKVRYMIPISFSVQQQ